MAFIEASLEELPVSANLGQSCLATKISAPGPSSFGWFRHTEESRLIQFLRNNHDVFAWSSSDLRGVNREVIEHELRVDPKVKPRKQRLRTMSEDRKKAAQSKVQKLLDAGVICEVQYPEWLANVVMVPKKNGSW